MQEKYTVSCGKSGTENYCNSGNAAWDVEKFGYVTYCPVTYYIDGVRGLTHKVYTNIDKPFDPPEKLSLAWCGDSVCVDKSCKSYVIKINDDP
jgi:hypothetical protein